MTTSTHRARQHLVGHTLATFNRHADAQNAKHLRSGRAGAAITTEAKDAITAMIQGKRITESEAIAAGFHPRVAHGPQAARVTSGWTGTTTTATRTPQASSTPTSEAMRRIGNNPRELSAHLAQELRDMYSRGSVSDIAPGLAKALCPDLFGGWHASNATAWTTAVHEAGHAVVALQVGAGVSYATVDAGKGGSGRCMLTKLDTITVEDHAAIDFAGVCAGGGSMRSTCDATGDRDHYEERVAEAGNRPGFDDDAMGTAERICSGFRSEILAVARLLYANQGQHVSGDDIRFIIDFHAGKYPDLSESIKHERSMARWR